MGSNYNQDRLHPFAKVIIRKKARFLLGRYGILPSDIEDIRQTLMLDVLRRADRFDPLRGSENQFVSTVVRHGIARIVERRLTAKRGSGYATVSLDEEFQNIGGKSFTLHDVVDKHTYLSITKGPFETTVNRLDIQIDLDRALAGLPRGLRELATRLMTSTPSEIARDTGIPRTTLNGLIAKLRSRLLINGFGEYLNFRPSDFKRFR